MSDFGMALYLLFLIFIVPILVSIVTEELCLLGLSEKRKKVYSACFFMNIFLNPITNHSLIKILGLSKYFPYYGTLVILVIFSVSVEAIVYMLIIKDIKKGLYYSVVLNIASLALSFAFLFAK